MKLTTAGVLIVLGGLSGSHNGAASLPANYRVQLENDWVKVTSVRYGPLENLPGHTHTPHASAYVYLSDGPAVKFRHIGGHNAVATRPPTKAGAFRVYRGLDEVHAVENTGRAASEFLRVELKTSPLDADTFRGKFERPLTASSQPIVHFDHPQVRISRLWAIPGQQVEVATSGYPALLIALQSGAGFERGQAQWVAPSTTVAVQNPAASAVDFLRFDFKTQPAATIRR